MARKRQGGLSRHLVRLAPFGTMAGLGALAVTEGWYFLAGLLGVGAAAAARRLLDRRGNARKELWRRARANAAELGRVGRADGIAAPQMKRLAGLQEGLLESWELLPEEYGPLLLEDLHTVVDELETAANLAHPGPRTRACGARRRLGSEGLVRGSARRAPGGARRLRRDTMGNRHDQRPARGHREPSGQPARRASRPRRELHGAPSGVEARG